MYTGLMYSVVLYLVMDDKCGPLKMDIQSVLTVICSL